MSLIQLDSPLLELFFDLDQKVFYLTANTLCYREMIHPIADVSSSVIKHVMVIPLKGKLDEKVFMPY